MREGNRMVPTPRAAELYVMGVRREQHRRGIGRALVAEAERWLRPNLAYEPGREAVLESAG